MDFAVAGRDASIRVFTTRPDTLFGATYMVLAPEHPLVAALTTQERRGAVEAYIQACAKQDLVERQKTDKNKTGVFTGGYCVNPVNGARIPVWIADYVLMGYGTGAIMAVPGHDSRDFEFATAFDLPIVRVIAAPGEDADTPLEQAFAGDGRLVNSGAFDGLAVADAKRAIVDELAARGVADARINYRLHDWCVSRQRYWGPPIPIIHCSDCGAVPVPESELPVELPYLDDFQPDDSGISPLARAKGLVRNAVSGVWCGGPSRHGRHRQLPVQRLVLPALSEHRSRRRGARCGVDGQVAARGLLHRRQRARGSASDVRALPDDGAGKDLQRPRSFRRAVRQRFRAHGLLIRDGRKMSKSRGNVINPDEIIERVRCRHDAPVSAVPRFLRAGGRLPESRHPRTAWLPEPALAERPRRPRTGDPDPDIDRALHRTIKQVSEQVPALQFNTAIAAMMEYLNAVRADGRTPKRAELAPLVIMLAPFAPHIAEELHARLGNQDSLFETARWPTCDEAKIAEATVEIGVQVNGRMRGRIVVAADASEEAVVAAAKENDNVARHLHGTRLRKTIVVPGRLVNLVVG